MNRVKSLSGLSNKLEIGKTVETVDPDKQCELNPQDQQASPMTFDTILNSLLLFFLPFLQLVVSPNIRSHNSNSAC